MRGVRDRSAGGEVVDPVELRLGGIGVVAAEKEVDGVGISAAERFGELGADER